MKIAISAVGQTLDAEVDPRFGRCRCFIFIDPETMQFEVAENSSAMAAGGAGISAAQMVADKGVQAVLTGNCGPNAYQVLSAADIPVITGVSGSVRDAAQQYKEGKFQQSPRPNVAAHFGSSTNTEMGMASPFSPVSRQQSQEQELSDLKAQSQMLAQQLSEIQSRIEEIEKKN
jgi:predicted Fe-Mo cluster-binding NifX family protein